MTAGRLEETFNICEPFPTALRMVRKALAQQGLRIPNELDVAARIRQEVGAGVARCTVFYVDDPVLLLEAIVFHRGAGLAIPQPLVVSGMDRHTEVLIWNASSLVDAGLAASVRDPLLNLYSRIVRALMTIAEPEGVSSALSRISASI
ncbi:MAG: hypothetical protein ABFD89_17215 [Bryobacteraceae bacterium]